MQTSDCLSLVAIGMSVLAWINSKRAVRVTLYDKRVPVRDALVAMRRELSAHGSSIGRLAVIGFYENCVVPSDAVFSRSIHRKLEALARDLGELEELHRRFDIDAPVFQREPLATKTAALELSCRKQEQKVERKIARAMRIGGV